MADNVTLNAGSGGDSIATEDVAGVEYQKVKLVDGTATSTTAIPLSGDLANGLDVDVTRVGGTVTVDLGANNDVTVTSGTVTANLGATDNAVLDQIEVNTSYGDSVGGGTEAAALRVTLANDSTGVVSVDDGGGTLTVDGTVTANLGATDNAVLDSIVTNTTGLAGCVSGSELQVDIVSGGTVTQYAEDAVHTTGDTGTMALAVRNDTLAALAGTDGDYAPLQVTATGALYVEVDNITSEVTFGTTTYTETTSTGLLSGAVRNDTLAALASTDNEVAPLQVNASGALYVDGSDSTQPVSGTVTANLSATDNAVLDTIETNTDFGTVTGGGVEASALRVTIANDSTGVVSVDDGGGTLTVDGTVTANLSATDNAVLDTIETNTDFGTVTGGGVEATALRVTLANDSTGVISIDDGGNTITVDGTVTANLGATDNAVLDSIDTNTGAAIKADDAAFTLTTDSVNMMGAIRDDALTTLTAVEGDAVPLRVGSTGALHVTGGGGGTQYEISDAAPTTVTMAGVIRDDALTTLTEVDGDATALRVSSTGALHVTGGGGGTEYTEDVATANPIVGSATLMERDDALTTVTPVEGDWIGLRGSAEGALWTQDFNSDAILSDTTAILADTANMDTNLGTVAGAVAAGQMQVDIVADGAGLLTTSAHDAAFGTAGTADAQVRSVQGIAGGTALPVSGTVTANPASGTIDTVTTVGSVTTCNLAAETTKVIGTVNLSATDNTVLDNIQTSVDTVAAAVSTEMQVDIVGALPAGTAAIGKLAANSGVDIGDVDVTSISAGSNLIGDVGIGVRTTGGSTFYLNQDTSAVASVKASAGTLYSICCFNTHTAPVYLNLYNVASGSVTLGTTTPSMQFVVPTQAATANGGGFVINFAPGIAFGTAITVACATTFDGSTDPGTNLVITNICYA